MDRDSTTDEKASLGLVLIIVEETLNQVARQVTDTEIPLLIIKSCVSELSFSFYLILSCLFTYALQPLSLLTPLGGAHT